MQPVQQNNAPAQEPVASQGTPVDQIPQSGQGDQMVPEPDAPDESDGEMPKTLPLGVEPDVGQTSNITVTPVVPPVANMPDTSKGETDFTSVVLRGLNKVTARAQTIDVPIGSSVRFGTIEIVAHRCWKSAPEDRPENAALLEISEVKQGEPPAQIFLGWMFSSSPALSALENPFYDVTVIKCAKVEAEENSPVEKKVSLKSKKNSKNTP
jgi:hypothetical protein